ncbi:MAG: Fe-S cluster assembly protein SufD [Woeseiaceae bacterium]|nr:Fe-S cluster assembly protein SufD [Woeseiaceae bacterium]
MSQPALPLDALKSAVAALPDNALSGLRQRALVNFERTGFPLVRAENWKYTSLAPLIEISTDWLEAGAAREASTDLDDSPLELIEAHWLVIDNGRIDAGRVDKLDVAGVTVAPLGASGTDSNFDWPLIDFNAALLEDGLSIRIDADVERPIGILIVDSASDAAAVSQSRVEIEVAANCSARFIEYHRSVGANPHYANTVVDVVARQGARVEYVRLQERAREHSQTARLSALLQRDARLHHSAFDLGGKLIRNDLHIDIAEAGAEALFDGLYVAGDGQHIDNHTRVDHRVGPAVSRQEYRGILKGKARCIWNGKAIVHDDADGTDAEQANHNLLLSKNAEIDAKPELEIYADDVKCAHGTTVGQLDETALFYLRTRGLDKEHATRVMTHAFAAEVVSRVPLTDLREHVTDVLEQRLGKLTDGDST